MELTIDTASPLASVALTDEGRPRAETTWRVGRGHAAELLPSVERLLDTAAGSREQLQAIFVCRGPGSYAGLRVGVSTAMALAFALGCDLLGYGRLEADAFPYLPLGRPVCAVHDAGRGELAWAVYDNETAPVREIAPPRIGAPDDLLAALPADAVVVGELPAPLAQALAAQRSGATAVTGAPAIRRAATAAALAWQRYAAGARDSHLALTPIYLREPNITQARPQRRIPAGRDGSA